MKSVAPLSDNYRKLAYFWDMTKMVLAAILKGIFFFFKFYYSNVNLLMSSYVEPNFIEKFFREKAFFFFF